MPRPSSRDETRKKVRNYLAIAEGNLPNESPLNIQSVALALGISRTTIYKYGLDEEINTAAKRQQENAKITGKAEERRAYADRLRDLAEQLQKEREKNLKLVARFALVEANAARLGINPEDLFVPIAKPDRSVSRAGSGKRKHPFHSL